MQPVVCSALYIYTYALPAERRINKSRRVTKSHNVITMSPMSCYDWERVIVYGMRHGRGGGTSALVSYMHYHSSALAHNPKERVLELLELLL